MGSDDGMPEEQDAEQDIAHVPAPPLLAPASDQQVSGQAAAIAASHLALLLDARHLAALHLGPAVGRRAVRALRLPRVLRHGVLHVLKCGLAGFALCVLACLPARSLALSRAYIVAYVLVLAYHELPCIAYR